MITQSKIQWLRSTACLLFLFSLTPTLALAKTTCYDAGDAHQCLTNNNSVAACTEVLDADPYDLSVRFSLCEAQINSGALVNALIVLDQGLQLCGRNENSCSRLRDAIRLVESNSKEQLGSAELRAAHAENRKLCVRRSRRGEPVYPVIIACEQALVAFPKDPDLHAAHGEKLLLSKQPARAVLAFRRALTLRPGDPNFLSWHDAAEDARQTMVERCLRHTELSRCNRAILPGTKDEAQLHLRRSDLYLEKGNKAAALESLLIVQIIEPSNRQVSNQLLQLVPANIRIDDERLYLPRGRALLTNGNYNAAIRDLRRATQRNLDKSTALELLGLARQQRAAVVQDRCFDAKDLNACQTLLVAGEPDEQEIRRFIESVTKAEQSKLQQPALATAKVPPASAQPRATATTPALPLQAVVTKPISVKNADNATASYLNRASANGVTH